MTSNMTTQYITALLDEDYVSYAEMTVEQARSVDYPIDQVEDAIDDAQALVHSGKANESYIIIKITH